MYDTMCIYIYYVRMYIACYGKTMCVREKRLNKLLVRHTENLSRNAETTLPHSVLSLPLGSSPARSNSPDVQINSLK